MRTRGIILVVMALFFAGGVMLLARAWLTSQTPSVATVSAPTSTIALLVTRDRMTLGQIIKPSDLVWQSWPDVDLNPGYILQGTRNPADFAGWVVRSQLGKGDPVTVDKIVAPGDRGFFAAVLGTGMRAVSIAVDSTSGIAGFVFPGDKVDLLLTHTLTAEGTVPHRATETILQDLRVIAIDQQVSDKQNEPTVVHNVTVEVTPKQSEIIAVATVMGKLSLSLRSIARDPDGVEAQLAQADPANDRKHQTFTLDDQASRLLGAGGENAPPPHVTVLHGGATENVVFGAGAQK